MGVTMPPSEGSRSNTRSRSMSAVVTACHDAAVGFGDGVLAGGASSGGAGAGRAVVVAGFRPASACTVFFSAALSVTGAGCGGSGALTVAGGGEVGGNAGTLAGDACVCFAESAERVASTRPWYSDMTPTTPHER